MVKYSSMLFTAGLAVPWLKSSIPRMSVGNWM